MRPTAAWFLKQAIHMSNWYGISDDRKQRIRAEITDEVRDDLKAALTPQIEAQVEQALWDKAFADARKTIESELAAEKPTARERKAFRKFVEEVELDCHAQATVASAEADRDERQLRWSRRVFNTLIGFVGLGTLPTLYALYNYFGNVKHPGVIVAALTLVATFITLCATTTNRHERLERRAKNSRKVSSDYLVVAERAKTCRLVRAERLDTKKELDKLTEDLSSKKSYLDDKFHPRTEDLHLARDSVRVRIDTQPPFHDFDDFEERLRTAEAEAEAAEEAEARVVR